MYKSHELEYKPTDTRGFPEGLICHYCGKSLPLQEVGCLVASIPVSGGSLDFHFCSTVCSHAFQLHPAANIMIYDVYRKVTGEELPDGINDPDYFTTPD